MALSKAPEEMRFRYLLDPLFLGSVALFLVNKLLLRPHLDITFLSSHLNDVICIPLWVPVLVTLMRITGMRRHDRPPEAHEILIPLLAWSWIFEVFLPQTDAFAGIATADPLDVLSYTVGAALAAAAWRWIYRSPMAAPTPTLDSTATTKATSPPYPVAGDSHAKPADNPSEIHLPRT